MFASEYKVCVCVCVQCICAIYQLEKCGIKVGRSSKDNHNNNKQVNNNHTSPSMLYP